MSDEKGDGEPTSPKSDKDIVETTDSPRGGRSSRDRDEDGDRDRSRNKHRSGDRRDSRKDRGDRDRDRDRERDRERDYRGDSHRSSRDYRPRDRDSRSRSYHDRKPDRDDRPRKPILDEFGRDITLRNVDRERGRNDRRDYKKDERADVEGDGKPDERRSDNKRPRDAAADDDQGAKRQKVEEAEQEIDEEPEPELSLEALGLPAGFNSTKGKKVEGNDVGSSQVISKRIYRQYMNRRGGFNRNLEPDRNAERHTTKPAKPKTGLPAKAGKPKGSKK